MGIKECRTVKRIKLEVAYDGTHYCGWQIQPNGITIEETLKHCLESFLQEEITLIGASRTDAGVHALANVAVFDTSTKIPAEKIAFAMNQRLPADIRVQRSEQVADTFHPRYCNSTKWYEYQILNRRFPLPSKRLYSYFVYAPLCLEAMQEAATYLVGEHDFKSFCSARTNVQSTIRTISHLSVRQQEEMIYIRIAGNGFLYNMVRIIVGTLVKVGLQVYSPEMVGEILAKKNRQYAGPKAPANGLTLLYIEYEKNK